MRSARLSLALESGALVLPGEGRIAVHRPRIGDSLLALPQERVVVLTGFRPDHDHFARAYAVAPAPPYAAAIVCLPRSRAAGRALIAQAAAEVAPGGWVAVDGQKTDGIDTALKDLRKRVELSESLSKAHGKLASFPVGPDLSDWLARPSRVEGFQTLPGVFSADGSDRGSILLIVYSAFGAGTVAGIWRAIPASGLVLCFGVVALLLALAMGIMVAAGRLTQLPRPDQAALFFCGSTKSLASGLPIATAIFPAAMVGATVLPLMIYHMTQLLVCSAIAQRMARTTA